jgi:hypothetical protein
VPFCLSFVISLPMTRLSSTQRKGEGSAAQVSFSLFLSLSLVLLFVLSFSLIPLSFSLFLSLSLSLFLSVRKGVGDSSLDPCLDDSGQGLGPLMKAISRSLSLPLSQSKKAMCKALDRAMFSPEEWNLYTHFNDYRYWENSLSLSFSLSQFNMSFFSHHKHSNYNYLFPYLSPYLSLSLSLSECSEIIRVKKRAYYERKG